MSETKGFYAGLGSGLDTVKAEEIYVARAERSVAKRLADTENPFTIEVRFLGGLTEHQKQAFKDAADRWAEVIVGDLQDVELADGTVIDDVRIDAAGVEIDGPGRVLGRAGPDLLRPEGSTHEFLTITGGMEFDVADIPRMIEDDLWDIVIMHEMGHVIGMLDFVWSLKGLVSNKFTPNWSFVGQTAKAEFAKLRDPCAGVAIDPEPAGARLVVGQCGRRRSGPDRGQFRPRHHWQSLAGERLWRRDDDRVRQPGRQPAQQGDWRRTRRHRLHRGPRRMRPVHPSIPDCSSHDGRAYGWADAGCDGLDCRWLH